MNARVAGGPLLIGLSGPIGCGKSTVRRMLGELGALVIDADAVARQATERGSPALADIRARFGDGVVAPDGTLDRGALARIVFNDPAALAELERITHPRVRELIDARLAEAADDGVPVAAIEAIKLVEGGLAERCDEVWLVECSAAIQRERLVGRGATSEDIDARLAAQGEQLADRLAGALEGRVAYRRLNTDGSLDQTRDAVEDALAELLAGEAGGAL